MFATRIEDGSIRRIVIRPNRSLTWGQTKAVYLCIASYSLAIAGTLAVMGFWPVLPFAGGEIALLGIAFYVNALAGKSVQVVTVGTDVVKVEKERPGPRCEWLFQRAWAQVDIHWAAGHHSSRLVVRMFATRIEDGSIRRIVIRPNRSLTWGQTKAVYLCIASYSLAIAGTLAVMGFWPVLPFAGGEIALLGIAFYVNALAGKSVQVVTVGTDVVKVEKERPGPRCEWLFQRAWDHTETR